MALTEEEKKKKLQQDISLDEWYNTNQQNIERQAQQQYEDAYVNRELMNKYLNQNLANQGLADTGIANLYAQQANTDYMNQRANIANAQKEAETNLFNQYYSKKKAEKDETEKQIYDMYSAKINNSVNDYGYIDQDTLVELNDYITQNADQFGSKYQQLLQSQLDFYKPNQKQIEAYKEGNYQSYLDDLYGKIGEAQGITDEYYDSLVEELNTQKDKIGDENYNNALQSLTAYKTMGDVMEKIDTTGKVSIEDYNQLKASIEKLKEDGAITNAAYQNIIENLEALKKTLEEDTSEKNKQLQNELLNGSEGLMGDDYEYNAAKYSALSNDNIFEKFIRTGVAGVKNNINNMGKAISDGVEYFFKDFIPNLGNKFRK
jgi:hypothetical protein